MNRKNVKTAVQYYYEIPNMMRLLRQEKDELESLYDSLGSVNMDGMPHGSAPGRGVEGLAMRTDSRGVWERLQEIDVRQQVLEGDEAALRDVMDSLNGKYKNLLSMRYCYRYSWVKISVRLSVPDSTVRSWHERALLALADGLKDAPMMEEILGRASRARF
ncbi:MAG: hypothetical protein NC311_12575 [Muribaculaceae bacterium]|nr:hypothetical protein [Muribaculaceae bacterium]